MKYIIPISLLLLTVLTACVVTPPEVPSDATITMRTYGGFTLADRNEYILTITPDQVEYTIGGIDGIIVRDVQPITRQEFMDLVTEVYFTNNFYALDEVYVEDPEGPQVADVPNLEITFASERRGTKVVEVNPLLESSMSPELQTIYNAIVAYRPDINQERITAEKYARQQYDSVQFQSYVVRESYPEQHVFSFLADGETIDVVVVQGEVQQPGGTIDPLVLLKFQPAQCEDTPWQTWYGEGNINYLVEPTDKELIQDYYSMEYEVQVSAERIEQTDFATCSACGCATTYYFQATTSLQGAAVLEDDGWTQI